jgi:hypothetical protein
MAAVIVANSSGESYMKFGNNNFIFCNYCASNINTKKSPMVCDNNTCVHYNEVVDKNGDLKNV